MMTPTIKHYNKLNSTNSYGLDNFEELQDGDIIVSDIQTSGRGRFDRVWEGSSPENIYMSFVIKPKTPMSFPFMNLTQYLSVVVNRVLNRDYGIVSNIKWPNDILFEKKKICGILSEAKMVHNSLVGIVLGIGINVNADISVYKNLPQATSISEILGKKIDKNNFLNQIIAEFYKGYKDFAEKGFLSVIQEYKSMCKFSDGKVRISGSFNDGEFKFVSINDDGTLTVLDKTNQEVNVITGDIIC